MPKTKASRSEVENMEYIEATGGLVNVDFEAFKAEDIDFYGIKNLISQGLKGLKGVDISGIANIIISQNYVGSVVKQVSDGTDEDDVEDEDELFGVSTVINLTSRKNEPPIKSFISAFLKRCRKHSSKEVYDIVTEHFNQDSINVGLLISERLVNLPPQFSIPVFDSLQEETDIAFKSGMPYKFDYFIMLSKLFKLKAPGKAAKGKKGQPIIDEIIWSNPEEEIFAEECTASFEYCLEGTSGNYEENDSEYIPWRRVLIINADKLPEIITKIKNAVT